MAHEGHWQIVRGDDGRMLTIPPTVMFVRADPTSLFYPASR
jgi:hypothetical protein